MAAGRRYDGEDALSAGIVDRAVPEEEVPPAAVALAGTLAARDGATTAAIRRTMYAPVLDALRER